MKKFTAIFYKEFQETRWDTLIFLLVGVCYYFAATLVFDRYGYTGGVGSCRLSHLFAGGIVALWLNATLLCATSFARERENGTIETLRRIAPRWQFAALAKFCYVFVSTAFLAAIVLGVSLIVDAHYLLEYGATIRSFFHSDDGLDLTTFVRGSGLGAAFCWGVFWTGRVERQVTSIFLAIVSALGASMLTIILCKAAFDSGELVDVVSFAIGLVALALAPGRSRFGYRDAPNPKLEEFSGQYSAAAADDRRAISEFKQNVANAAKPRTFPALVGCLVRQTALLFRSPASLLFELATVTLVATFTLAPVATIISPLLPKGAYAGELLILCYGLYFVALVSGLFLDAKESGSPLKERFAVGLWSYWFANAFVAGFYLLAACLLAYNFTVTPLDDFLTATFPTATLFFGVALWSAAASGGRLVVAARTLIVFTLAFVGVRLIFDAYPVAFCSAPIATVALGGGFAILSIPIVARRLREKKSPVLSFVPMATLAIAIAIPAFHFDFNQYSSSSSVEAIPDRIPAEASSFARLPKPSDAKEYQKLVDKALVETRETSSFELFSSPILAPTTWGDLNSAARQFLTTEYLASRRLAAPGSDVKMEKNLYDAIFNQLSGMNARPTSYVTALEFLAAIPRSRPNCRARAENQYVYYRADGRVVAPSFQAKETLETLRKAYPQSWSVALWNSCRLAESRGALLDYYLNDSEPPILAPGLRSYYADFSAETINLDAPFDKSLADSKIAYNTFLHALDIDCASLAALEVRRRLAFLALAAAEMGTRDGFVTNRYPETYAEILADGRFPDAIPVPKDQRKSAVAERALDEEIEVASPPTGKGLYPVLTARLETSPSNLSPQSLVHYPDHVYGVGGRSLNPYPPKKMYADRSGKNVVVPVALPLLSLEDADVKIRDRFGVSRPKNQTTIEYGMQRLFNADGSVAFDVSGAQYFGCRYNAVDSRGEPIYFTIAPCDEEPPFEHEGYELFNGYSEEGEPIVELGALQTRQRPIHPDPKAQGGKAYVCRVRALKPFERNGENVFLVKDLWLLHHPGVAATFGQPFVPASNVYVDATGAEVLNADGRPKYSLKEGVFCDKRHIVKPNFEYVFDLPGGIAERSETLRVVYSPTSGVYKDVPDGVFAVANGRVYSQIPAVGLAVASSWILNPTLDAPSNVGGDPVLVVAPIDRNGVAALRQSNE